MIYLGEVPPTQPDGIFFHPPIAISSARFMARIIYSITIEMFGATGKVYILMRKIGPGSGYVLTEKLLFLCFRRI